MKRFGWPLLVLSSVLAVLARGATRPGYGGTLHIQMRTSPLSLDPTDSSQPDSIARRNLMRLLFDPLVTIDDWGRIEPRLAVSWQAEAGNQRWRFWLRRGVKLDDGSTLNADLVAASLRMTNPSWNVWAQDDSVVIELNAPNPALAAELALARDSIIKRSPGKLSGTGPFQISDYLPGKTLVLRANEDYWGGRPFLDSIVIEFGKSMREQAVALELGKAELAEVAPGEDRRRTVAGRRELESAPIELMALVFARDPQSSEEGKLRSALALTIDRASIKDVLLGGEGETAGGVLPNWMTGYEFVFPAEANQQKARQERGQVRQAPTWTLAYDSMDPLSRLVAERVALNARDLDIKLELTNANHADLRLVRVPLASVDPRLALANAAGTLGLTAPKFTAEGIDALFQAEKAILETRRIIPLFHLTVNYQMTQAVKNWDMRRDGSWALDNVWVSSERP